MPKSNKDSVATATSIRTLTLPPVVPEFVGNDPLDVIFPEWSDHEINILKWAVPPGKEPKSPKSPASGEKRHGLLQENMYVDPHHICLPSYFVPNAWKRPKEIYPNVPVVVRSKDEWGYSDLISGNKHLFHSEFMRSFISAIGILEYLGFMNPWTMEGLGAEYVPNTDDRPWRGWHHIYSLCKAGKGQHHDPQVNNIGKYAVRLYWMGSWRLVMVDDLFPVDSANHILLPTTEKIADPFQDALEEDKASKAKNKEIELWPFLLCKALLKVASLTWNEKEDLVDCDIISMLTGWLVQKVNVSNSNLQDIWDMCAAYSDHFTWPEPATENTSKTNKEKRKSGSAATSISGVSSKGKKQTENAVALPYCLVASCLDMRDVPEEELPDFAPCWSHNFLIDQSRDIPLVKPSPQPELARWKRFRWLAWAIKTGLYFEEHLNLIKCLKVVSSFKKCSDHITYNELSDISKDIRQSVDIIEEVVQDKTEDKKKEPRDKSKDKKKKESSDKSKDQKSKSVKSKKSKTDIVAPEDPSIWGDFNVMHSHFSHLYIYTKPSLFVSNIKISDFKDKSKPQKKKATDKKTKDTSDDITLQKRFIWSNRPGASRNEPFYIFMDSLDFKFIMINLSQVGNKNLLLSNTTSDEDIHPNTTKPISNIVVEKYDWRSDKIGDLSVSLNCLGSKSILLQIKPGRHGLRLWIKSDASFVIHVVSDVYLSAGTQESVFEYMQNESRLLLQMCFDIGGHFGKLVQAFGAEDFNDTFISFHASYKPENKLTKMESTTIQKEFSNELYKLILEKYDTNSSEILFALRILLIDFRFDYSRTPLIWELKSNSSIEIFDEEFEADEESINESFIEEKRRERAATKIQALFKMIYVKKLLAYRQDSHPKYRKTFETLKRVYKDLFSVEKRIITISKILRKMLLDNKNLIGVREYYQLYQNLQSVVHFQVATNVLSVQIDSWVPIGRYIFYVNSADPVLVKLCIACDTDVYYLRVFNNDTGQEIRRFTLNTTVEEYILNENGYTVLIYGWSGKNLTMPMKFFIITLKKGTDSMIILPEMQVTQSFACDNYDPNVNNLIGKCQVFINQDTAVSFKFSCTSDNVKVRLQCVDEKGHVCAEITGVGNIILPIVNLKYEIKKEIESQLDSNLSKRGSFRSKSSSSRGNSFVKKKRRSSETGSLKSSVLSIKGSRKNSSGKFKTADLVYYVVEIYALEDTWPLCISEWRQVDNLQKKKLIGPKLFPDLFSIEREVPTIEKLESSKQMQADKRGQTDRKSNNTPIVLDEPAWCIQTVFNKTDEVRLVVDKRRQEEISNIKKSWFEGNQDRYAYAQELRHTYLELQYLKAQIKKLGNESEHDSFESSLSSTILYNTEEDEVEDSTETDAYEKFPNPGNTEEEVSTYIEPRTTKKPISESKTLLPLDYSPYAMYDKTLLSNEDTTHGLDIDEILSGAKLKTREDAAQDEENLNEAKREFEESLNQFQEEALNLRLAVLNQNLLLEHWFQECRDDSKNMMKSAYNDKLNYIADLEENAAKTKLEAKKKKGK